MTSLQLHDYAGLGPCQLVCRLNKRVGWHLIVNLCQFPPVWRFLPDSFHHAFNSPLKVLPAVARLHGSLSTCSSSGRATHGLDPPEMACLASLSTISLPATPSCPDTQLMVTCAPCHLPLRTHSAHDL